MSKNRYAIIGSGALGGLYGGMLAKAGFEVHFLLHRDFDHVQQHGLKVESIGGDFHLPSVHAHRSPETMPACDVTLLGLKTTKNHLLRDLLPAPTRGGGVVLCLQNGLNVEADSAAIVGNDRVLGGCCFLCSNKIGPGHIRHLDQGRIVFGEWPGQSDFKAGEEDQVSTRAAKIQVELREAGIQAKATSTLMLTRWRKLMWNVPFNGLSVALDASTKQLIENENAVELAYQLIREVHGGAAANGIEIPIHWMDQTIDVTRRMVPYDSSMRLDFLAGRPMEIDAIFGRPLQAAQEAGFDMPSVRMLQRQLLFLQEKR